MLAEIYLKERYAEGKAEDEEAACSLHPAEFREYTRRNLEADERGENFNEPPPSLNERSDED